MSQQNLILPAGTARIGDREFLVKTNSSPATVAAMNDMPVRAANGAVVMHREDYSHRKRREEKLRGAC